MTVETTTGSIPTMDLSGVTVSKLILGGNPFSGFSHQSEQMDTEMRRYFTTERIHQTLFECERNGITTFVGRADNHITRALLEYYDKGGTIQWIAQTAVERRVVEDNVKMAKYFGAKACYIHGGYVDQLWNEEKQEKIREILKFIKDQGLPAGLASHNPERIQIADEEGYGADFFMVSLYNISGRMGNIIESKDELFNETDREKALAIIPRLSKPAIAYKVLAAGRKDPEKSFRQVFGIIKPSDGILVGMYPNAKADMIRENAELVKRLLHPKADS